MLKSFHQRIHEIDSLRAIAIIGVVSSHIGGFYGGFLGVDMFFVISGYVIMLSTLKHQENNSFSLVTFYHHRIRRIVPPLLFVSILIYCIIVYTFIEIKDFSFIINSYKLQSFFLHNYYFVGESLDYFHGLNEAKLNIHLWSIAVEEQFYIIFPIIYFLTYKKQNNLLFSIVITILAILSALIMIDVIAQPTTITQILTPYDELNAGMLKVSRYYLLYSRFWQLSLGVVACLFSNLVYKNKLIKHIPQLKLINMFFIFTNILLIIYAMLYANPNKTWPNLFSLVPTISTALLMVQFHIFQDKTVSLFLNTSPIQLIGKSSYSIYLYHWPIYGILKYTNSDFGTFQYDYFLYVMLLFFISLLSYFFIEKNIRKLSIKYSILCLIVFIGFHYIVSYTKQPKIEERSSDIKTILETGAYSSACKTCTDNPTNDFIILWGDSHSYALVESVEEYCSANNLELVQLRKAPMIPFVQSHVKAKELIKSSNFKAMILAARWSMYIKFPENEPEETGNRYYSYKGTLPASESEAIDVFNQSFIDLLNEITGANTIILLQVPRFPFFPKKDALMDSLHMRLRPFNKKTIEEHKKDHMIVNNIISTNTKNRPHTFVIDPSSILCTQDECRWREGNNMLYKDDDHLSIYGAKKIIPLIKDQLNIFIDSTKPVTP